ncbi:MAG: primosomal protein N' [Neisseriaceae bacterium]|nr:MAG: primosomal protein N' [Neisseriaceae bacterium]
MEHLTKPQFFFDIAVDKPLYQLFTYQYHQDIPLGSRVIIPFGTQKVTGIVIHQNAHPKIQLHKIKSIEQVLDAQSVFSPEWIALIKFTATYYLYPIGQAFFSTLPIDLKQNKSIQYPEKPLLYQFNQNIQNEKPPQARHQALLSLWNALKNSFISLDEAIYLHPNARSYLKKYQTKGLLHTKTSNYFNHWEYRSKRLNQEQTIASQTVIKHINQFKCFLLFGITGSGKTELYFELINRIIQEKKQVLMLLPIINLTPQFFSRVKETFPQANIAILHSKIAKRQRLGNYLNASNGTAQIIIGTRLSIFTPIKNLGLIIVDEEHDDSFKQENDLRYNARDLAIWRAQKNNCPIVLGSATPSLESWYNVSQKKYQLITLTNRAISQAHLPDIHLISTKDKILHEGFTDEVLDQIKNNLLKKELTLIYLNRRGYAPAIVCLDCGHVIQCRYCSAKMVYHKQQQRLKCHHCEYEQTIPTSCPKCGNQDLTSLGMGTERVEQFLQDYLPTANITRVDSDTIANKNAWTDIYEGVLNNEIDILIGTQILAKGHDFKNLSLVVVINADDSLFSAHYRATEKLFSELIQVSGRAGRNKIKGRVLVQTKFPEHPLFQALKKHNYPEFAEQQLSERLLLGFPPKSHRIVIKAEHVDFNMAEAFLKELTQAITPEPEVTIIGPLPMTMLKIANRERAILYFESENRAKLHQTVKRTITQLMSLQNNYRTLKWIIDVDPHEI